MSLRYNKLNENDPYQPGEREAMDGLFRFERNTLPDTLEKEISGSTRGFWIEGSPMHWQSMIPVLADDSDKERIIGILANVFEVSKDDVEFAGADYQKIKKDIPSNSDNYIPYSTERRLKFKVDWKDTKNEDLLRYKNYIQKSMRNQGIQWEKELIESLNRSTTEALEKYIYNKFLYNSYGLVKMSENIAEIIVTPNTVDIAFDFANPVGTEVEVTEKRIDRVMTEFLVNEFFKDLKRTPFFKLVPNGHRWVDKRAFMCLYDIVQYNEKR